MGEDPTTRVVTQKDIMFHPKITGQSYHLALLDMRGSRGGGGDRGSGPPPLEFENFT